MFRKIDLFIRSLIFFIYSIVTIVLYSFVCIAATPCTLRFRHTLIRNYMHLYFYVLKKVCRLEYRVEGMQHVPKNTNGIIMCKHSSTWETFFLPQYFHTPAALAKRELGWIPFFGWGLALSDPIFINRKDKKSAMQQIIEKGKKCLQQGRWIMIFPEGTRVPFGHAGHYKMGGARLAAATGYPILPIAHNAGWFWPKGAFIKKPGIITVVIGPLIESKDKQPEELLSLTKDWIETTMVRLSKIDN